MLRNRPRSQMTAYKHPLSPPPPPIPHPWLEEAGCSPPPLHNCCFRRSRYACTREDRCCILSARCAVDGVAVVGGVVVVAKGGGTSRHFCFRLVLRRRSHGWPAAPPALVRPLGQHITSSSGRGRGEDHHCHAKPQSIRRDNLAPLQCGQGYRLACTIACTTRT